MMVAQPEVHLTALLLSPQPCIKFTLESNVLAKGQILQGEPRPVSTETDLPPLSPF